MGIVRWITDQRERVILGDVRQYLRPSEKVERWVRARHFENGRPGFVFLTDRQVIVHWTGRGDISGAFELSDLDSWGVDVSTPGGPVLAVEVGEQLLVVRLPTHTLGASADASDFLKRFERHAPRPRRSLAKVGSIHAGVWSTTGDVEVMVHKRSMSAKAKRAIVTILGLVMVIGGILLIPVPGPWSFPILLAGLAVLASEYDWAKDALQWARNKYQQAKSKLTSRRGSREQEEAPDSSEERPPAA